MITIVTPFYNSKKTFERTFVSVLAQSYTDFTWIIVDDGSDKDEYIWLKNLISSDKRIILLTNTRKKGAGGSRNTGLLACDTDLVTFIDSDDTWDASFLETAVSFLSCGIPAITTGYRLINENNEFISDFLPTRVVYVDQISRGCDASCLTTAYNLKFCKETPLFGEVKARNDLYFVYNFLKQDNFITPLPIVRASYYVGLPSLSSNKFLLSSYMYDFARFRGFSRLRSLFEVFLWFLYGLNKYKSRYFNSIFK